MYFAQESEKIKDEGVGRTIVGPTDASHQSVSAKQHHVCTTKWLLLPSCLQNLKDLLCSLPTEKDSRKGILGKSLQPSQVDRL